MSLKTTKKNIVRTRYGKIEVAKTHSFSEPTLETRTSPYLQEKIVFLGTTQIFHEVPILIESLLGISVSESHVYRTVQKVSEEIEDPCSSSTDLQHIEDQPDSQVYVMMDGSFLFTDDGWREIKVGRVFTASPNEFVDKWDMSSSEYVAQRGHYKKFTEKFEILLPPKSACKKCLLRTE